MDHRVVILKGVGVQRRTARLPVRIDPLLTWLSQSEIGHGLTKEIYCPGWHGGDSKDAVSQDKLDYRDSTQIL